MNLIELLENRGIEFHDGHGDSHARPGWVQLHCPFCSDGQSKFHMGYNKVSRIFTCYKCGTHPRVNTLSLLVSISIQEAVRFWKENYSDKEDIQHKQYETPVSGKLELPSGIHKRLSKHARKYLFYREYSASEVHQIEHTWRASSIGNGEGLHNRLFIPVRHKDRIVSWTTRAIEFETDYRTKYISARPQEEIMHHKDLLYGEEFCTDTVIVCEGPLDVWKVGFGAVATFGVKYTMNQLLRISRFATRVILFDSEPEAQAMARGLAAALKDFPGRTLRIELDAPDPGSAKSKEIKKLRHAVFNE